MRAGILAIVLVLASPPTLAAATRCRAPTGAQVVARSDARAVYARVVHRDGWTFTTYWGCLASSQPRMRLYRAVSNGYDSAESFTDWQFSGRFAFAAWSHMIDHYGNYKGGVARFNLLSGRVGKGILVSRTTGDTRGRGHTGPIVVDARGRILALQTDDTGHGVLVLFNHALRRRTLDSGPGISNPRLGKTRAYWTQDGKQYSARFG